MSYKLYIGKSCEETSHSETPSWFKMWGRVTLSTTYITFIQPVIEYCIQVIIASSEHTIQCLQLFENKVLRIINLASKTITLLRMQILTDIKPLKKDSLIQHKLTSLLITLFERSIKKTELGIEKHNMVLCSRY